MADRDRQVERAREVLEEKNEEAKARAQREQPESDERPPDEPEPGRRPSPDERQQ